MWLGGFQNKIGVRIFLDHTVPVPNRPTLKWIVVSNEAGVQIDKRTKNVECTDSRSFLKKKKKKKSMCDLSEPYNTIKFYFQ